MQAGLWRVIVCSINNGTKFYTEWYPRWTVLLCRQWLFVNGSFHLKINVKFIVCKLWANPHLPTSQQLIFLWRHTFRRFPRRKKNACLLILKTSPVLFRFTSYFDLQFWPIFILHIFVIFPDIDVLFSIEFNSPKLDWLYCLRT